MNHCDRVDALLSAYVERETSPAETRFVDGHLTHCSRCRAQLGGLRSLLQNLSEMPRVQVSDDFTERVLARTVGTEPAGLDEPVIVPLPDRRPAWVLPLAAAATLALVLLATTRFAPRGVEQPIAVREPAATVPGSGATPASAPVFPQVEELVNLYPELVADTSEVQSLGTARDSYVLEPFELRSPVGGGEPVVTPVSAGTEDKVLVTF